MSGDQTVTKSIEERVMDIIAKQLGVERDKIKLESKLIDDLGADSLETVELVLELEDEFNIEIPDQDSDKITTIKDVIAYIKGKSE